MTLWIFLIILGMYLLERRINKRLPHYEKVIETNGRLWQKWGFGILIVALISTFIYIEFQDIQNETTIMWVFIFFIAVSWGYQAFLEWKFLDGKKYVTTLLVLAVGVFAILASHFMYEQLNKTTFGEELSSFAAEEYAVTEISIIYFGGIKKEQPRHVKITDSAMVKRLTEAPYDMKLQKKYSNVPTDYMMVMTTDTNKSYQVSFGENSVSIAGQNYVIHGPNLLLDTLESLELEWKDGVN